MVVVLVFGVKLRSQRRALELHQIEEILCELITFKAYRELDRATCTKTAAAVETLEQQAKTFSEINSAIASEQRKQPTRTRSFSQFRTAAEENFVG